MQTQHKVQLDARDTNPALIMGNNPYMAPVMQSMGMPPAGYPAGPPPGFYQGGGHQQHQPNPYAAPPPQYGAPPAPAGTGYGIPPPSYPPPSGQPYGGGAYPPPPAGYPGYKQ